MAGSSRETVVSVILVSLGWGQQQMSLWKHPRTGISVAAHLWKGTVGHIPRYEKRTDHPNEKPGSKAKRRRISFASMFPSLRFRFLWNSMLRSVEAETLVINGGGEVVRG